MKTFGISIRKYAALSMFCLGMAAAAGGHAQNAKAPAASAAPTAAAASVQGDKKLASVPGTPRARAAARLIREAEGELLFEHSTRVYYWAALSGARKGWAFDPELLYIASMFHDYGLTSRYGSSHLRFEVDGANAARDFLRGQGASDAELQAVWLAIALHTTNGISANLSPLASLLAEGANMDLVGLGYDQYSEAERNAVEAAHPRPAHFAESFMDALYNGIRHRPETTQGTGLADVMAFKDPGFVRRDFAGLLIRSPWTRAK